MKATHPCSGRTAAHGVGTGTVKKKLRRSSEVLEGGRESRLGLVLRLGNLGAL